MKYFPFLFLGIFLTGGLFFFVNNVGASCSGSYRCCPRVGGLCDASSCPQPSDCSGTTQSACENPGATCSSGCVFNEMCTWTCEPTSNNCSTTPCMDLCYDNCGGVNYGTSCPSGQSCTPSGCESSCTVTGNNCSTTTCGLACTDNCGGNAGTGTYCPSGQYCSGTCQSISDPTNLDFQCVNPGNQVTLTWSAAPGATSYYLRVDNLDLSPAWTCNGDMAPDDVCVEVSGTSYTISVNPNDRYNWWVMAVNGSYIGPSVYGSNIKCNPNCWNMTSSAGSVSVGSTVTLSATFQSLDGNLGAQIYKGSPLDGSINALYSAPASNVTTAQTYSTAWTPTASDVGTNTICCRAWNDAIAECRPGSSPNHVDGPPRWPCLGPSYCTTVTVGGSCSVSINPINVLLGQTTESFVSASSSGGNITKCAFSSSNFLIASVTPLDDTPANLFSTIVTGVDASATPVNYTVTCTMDDPLSSTCSATNTISVTTPAWFQVKGGNVFIQGSLSDPISPNAYEFNFIRDPVALLVYSSAVNPGVGAGKISNTEIRANATIRSRPSASFDLLFKKLPEDIVSVITDPISDSYLANNINPMPLTVLSSCASLRGYKICYFDGAVGGSNLVLKKPVAGDYVLADGERIILFVDNASVTFEGKVRLNNSGKSSFLVISEGHPNILVKEGIVIDPSVGGSFADGTPDLEGLFFTDKQFKTGHVVVGDDANFHLRGSVVADELVLQRNLGVGLTGEKNNHYPAEYFEFATDQVMAFPAFISLRFVSWSESQP